MVPGDCLYLPCGYWHQVRSYGAKNMAVTMLFSRIKSFNGSNCATKKVDFTPLSETGMVWTYPGYGPQTLGNLDPFELRENLELTFKGNEEKKFTYQDLKEHYNGAEDESKVGGEADALGHLLVKIFDTSGKGYITLADIQSASIQQLKEAANAIDPDPANTDTYEHYMFEPVHAKRLITRAIDKERDSLTLDSLTKVWMRGGGSKKIAKDLFDLFKEDKDTNEISRKEVERKLSGALKLFEKKRKADPSAGYFNNELKKDKEMFDEEAPDESEELDDKDDNITGDEETVEDDDNDFPRNENENDEDDNSGSTNQAEEKRDEL